MINILLSELIDFVIELIKHYKKSIELAIGEKIDINIDTGTQLVTKENANDFK